MADEFDDSNIHLDGTEATWELNAEGPIGGKYMGKFKFRCFLTPIQRISANRDYRELLGANPTLVTEDEDRLAYALTQLKYRIISFPPFWDTETMPGDIPDHNIIQLVLEASVLSESKFRKQLEEKKKQALGRAQKVAETMLDEQKEEEK